MNYNLPFTGLFNADCGCDIIHAMSRIILPRWFLVTLFLVSGVASSQMYYSANIANHSAETDYLNFISAALSAHRNGEHTKALSAIDNAINIYPRRSVAHTAKVTILAGMDNAAALVSIEQALSIKRNSENLELEGEILGQLGMYAEAVAALTESINNNNTTANFEAYRARSYAFSHLSQPALALKDTETALTLSPGNPQLWLMLAANQIDLNRCDAAKSIARAKILDRENKLHENVQKLEDVMSLMPACGDRD